MDRYAYSRNNPVNYNDPSGHWPEWWDWIQGAVYQYANDMTGGGVENLAVSLGVCMECNNSQAFVDGQQAGRVASTTVASVEQVVGAATTITAVAAIPSTIGGGLVCSGLTAGLCALPAAGAVAVETVAAASGVAIANAGSSIMSYIRSNPIANKAKGDAFRDAVVKDFTDNNYKVETEVNKKTPFGNRRIDIEVSSPDGQLLGGIETKTGGSRYTASQRAKDTWLAMQGYIVNLMRDR